MDEVWQSYLATRLTTDEAALAEKAKQQVQVDVKQQISVIAALQEAESRVIEGRVLQDEPAALTRSPTTLATRALTAEYATSDI